MASRMLYPELRVRVAESMSAFLVDWLRDGTVDIAVLYANSAPKGIKLHHIWSEDICVFATPEFAGSSGGDTMTFAQAASLPLVIPGVQHGLRSEERRVGKGVSVRVDLGGRRIIKKKKKHP